MRVVTANSDNHYKQQQQQQKKTGKSKERHNTNAGSVVWLWEGNCEM